MSARIIDGKGAAARVLEQVRNEVKTLKAEGIEPGLAVNLIANDPAS
ncbi:bifunctional methylenetetrahydrofolate dehydrogenase/methenyltetrahydrofolate cyclohydrolase, partial [Pseudomonas syringae pv. tagetis]